VRNQVRVHLWLEQRFGHPHAPLLSAMHQIFSCLVTGTCVAMTSDAQGTLLVAAPFGLDDMFDRILRANKSHGKRNLFTAKAASYSARCPWLRKIDWAE
jgi:hypothetical protein